MTSITCVGNELNLLDCPYNQSGVGVECGIIQDSHVVCQGNFKYLGIMHNSLYIHPAQNTSKSDCNDWDLRVVNGTSVREGRVEICFNSAWGTVCNDNYGVADAQTLCSQLNFEGEMFALLLCCFSYCPQFMYIKVEQKSSFSKAVDLYLLKV